MLYIEIIITLQYIKPMILWSGDLHQEQLVSGIWVTQKNKQSKCLLYKVFDKYVNKRYINDL